MYMFFTKVLPYVYWITHKETGQFYIGYREANKIPASEDLPIYQTSSRNIKKLKFENFNWKIIAEFLDGDSAYEFENRLIEENFKNPLCLNKHFVKDGKRKFNGSVNKGKILSDETKKKMSDSQNGKIRSEETCKKLSSIAIERCKSDWVNPFAGEKGSLMSTKKNKERALEGTNAWAGEKGSENSKKICAVQIENGTHPFQDKKKASERSLKQIENGTHMTKVIHICPHCNKSGKGWTMFRWHFDNCKFKI